MHPHEGVANERYKLIHFWRLGEWELYDLEADRAEMHNVYGDPAYAEVVSQLKAELQQSSSRRERRFRSAAMTGDGLSRPDSAGGRSCVCSAMQPAA